LKIFYLLRLYKLAPSNGVVKKIEGQYNATVKFDLPFHFIICIPKGVNTHYWHEKSGVSIIEVNSLQDYWDYYKKIESELSSLNFGSKDVIYSRAVPISYHSIRFNKQYNVIYEHNSKEIAEFYSLLRFGSLINRIRNLKTVPLRLVSSFFFYRKILKSAIGGIGVTEEICFYEKSFYQDYNIKMVSNGCTFDNEEIESKTLDDSIDLVVLAGSKNEWNGISRIVNSFKQKFEENFKVYMLGDISEFHKDQIDKHDNLISKKPMYGDELVRFINKMHLGVGTLELYKKDMEEACALKTREYLSKGLPVLIGYHDPDLIGNELENYVYHIPNDDSLIPFDKVVKWVKKLYRDKELNHRINNSAKSYISWEVKTQLLYQNIVEIFETRSSNA